MIVFPFIVTLLIFILIQQVVLTIMAKALRINRKKHRALAETKIGMAFDIVLFVIGIYIALPDRPLLFAILILGGIEARRGVEQYKLHRNDREYLLNIASFAFVLIIGAFCSWYFKNYFV
ncbi:DUF4181 domain-containing protein [Bacillus sp. B-jedd]|uniref:DUF4181 domain-containing protein n=1 Tax=Bacillus sp. B-jedd TaxID=1476857 RepID=UPI0005155BE3|nr:DUF4181 domain-containing protein [Bacillus sp. B-jedd]CEG28545.1 hypothetical protein BN1002_03467 [Bacillus sp. B-jedd]